MDRAALLGGTATAPSRTRRTRTRMAWSPADTLREGDRIVTRDGRTGVVKSVSAGAGLRTVHNFAVDGHHTYFVGEGHGVWVHNRYKIEMPKAEYKALKEQYGEKIADQRAQAYREEKILERFGITDPDRIAEIRRVQAETVAQQKIDRKYRTQIGPQTGPISLELDGKSDLARAIAFAGYSSGAETVGANYKKDQLFFEAILATDPTMLSASNKLAAGTMLNDNRNLMLQDNLTVQEFNMVASVGLWNNFVGVDTLPSGDSKDGTWKRSEIKAIDRSPSTPPPGTPADTAAPLDVRQALAGVAKSLVYGSNQGVRDAERGIVLSRDGSGIVGISEITIGSQTANAFESRRSSRHVGYVHAHRISGDRDNQKVGPGDNLIVRAYGTPTFMMTHNANKVYEIGRQGGDYMTRRIRADGSADAWQGFRFTRE